MPSFRSLFIAAVALAASTASAAKCDKDFTIESDGDVSEIASCSKFEGTLTIGEKVSVINLPGLERVTGDFVVNGARALTALTADRLAIIDGDFTLRSLTVLNLLSFPELVKVGGIDFQTLPALKSLGFAKGVSEATSVRITDTMLGSLDGLKLKTVTEFDINNNKFLENVNVDLTSVSEALIVAYNGKGVQAEFPELKWARNVTIRDAGLISFPKLEKVNSSIAFVNNTFEGAAFPKLKEAGDFSMISCIKLTNLTANALTSLSGTFLLANNTKLEEVTNFKNLATVGGSVDISGALTAVALPKLDDVAGSFNVQSTEELDCEDLDEYEDKTVRGDFVCEGKKEVAESTNGGVDTKGDGSSASSSDDDEEEGDDADSSAGNVAVNFGLAGVVGAFALFML